MARDLLMPSLRPLLMLMLLLTLGCPTDIPTTDKDIAARFLFFEYLPRYYPNVFR